MVKVKCTFKDEVLLENFLKTLAKNIEIYSSFDVYFVPWLNKQWKKNVLKAQLGKETKTFFKEGKFYAVINPDFDPNEVAKDLFRAFRQRDLSRSVLGV